jgi:hypothetical protein
VTLRVKVIPRSKKNEVSGELADRSPRKVVRVGQD